MTTWKRALQRILAREGADPWFALPVGAAMVLDAAVSLASQEMGTFIIFLQETGFAIP